MRTEPLRVGGNVGAYNAFWIDRGTTVVPTRRIAIIQGIVVAFIIFDLIYVVVTR